MTTQSQTEALKMALEAFEAETDPKWECNSYHPKIYEAITAIKEALMSFQDGAQQSKIPQRSEDKKERSDDNEQVEPVAWYRNEDIFGNQEMEPIFYATKAWDNCLPLYTHPPVPYVVEPRTAQPKAVAEQHKQEPKCIGKAWAMWGGPVVFDPPLVQPEQRSVSEHLEPVAYIKAAELEELKHCNGMSLWAENAEVHTNDSISKQLLPSGHIPVYTTPYVAMPRPQRTWVGLTDEDKKEYVSQDFGGNRLDAMDWGEKRLKEKNA